MNLRSYLCGTSQSIYPARSEPAPAKRPTVARLKREPGVVRLHTALHMPGMPRTTRGYRVVAELNAGGQALICLGVTKEEAVAHARRSAGTLPVGAVGLRLQEWVGSATAGRWCNVRYQRLLTSPRGGRRRRSA